MKDISILPPTGLEAGVDEAGRGPLVGAVYAAAVIMPEGFSHPLLNDSKKVSEKNRNLLRHIIENEAQAWSVAWATAAEVDDINILQATFLAMNRAILALKIEPEILLIDGNRFRNDTPHPFQTVVHGDARHVSIAAASILAKTHRDQYMLELHNQHPEYRWDKNQGYPTAQHLQAIAEHGLTPHHRLSFGPCRALVL